jgi:hypothetical protein
MLSSVAPCNFPLALRPALSHILFCQFSSVHWGLDKVGDGPPQAPSLLHVFSSCFSLLSLTPWGPWLQASFLKEMVRGVGPDCPGASVHLMQVEIVEIWLLPWGTQVYLWWELPKMHTLGVMI